MTKKTAVTTEQIKDLANLYLSNNILDQAKATAEIGKIAKKLKMEFKDVKKFVDAEMCRENKERGLQEKKAREEAKLKAQQEKTTAKEAEKQKKKEAREYENQLKLAAKKAKEEKRNQKYADEEAEKKKNKLLLDELEQTWETCNDDLFQVCCEADYRKAYFYFEKRLMQENLFRTFKDNGDIIKYETEQGIHSQRADIFLAAEIKRRLGEKALNFAIKEIVDSIRRSTYIERTILYEQPKHIKPVKNGLWDFKEKKLLPFSSDYIFLDRIEINYMASAKCPLFFKFLKEILPEKEILVIQEFMGYCLLNDNRFQKAVLFYGDGANGKSVLLKVIKKLLGDSNVANISLQHLESNTFALARLFGKSANIFFDLPKKALSQTSNFKIVVSGDSVSGERKGKDSFEFLPYTKMLFSCNEVPMSPDRTPAFFRRWLVLKFNEHYPEGDPRRIENLEQHFFTEPELEGILQFALDGLYRLLENKRFTEHMTQAEVEDFWLRHSDSVSAFILDMIEKSQTDEESKDNIYNSYEGYCRIFGYSNEERNHFFRRFKEITGLEEYKPMGESRLIRGLKLKSLPTKTDKSDENIPKVEK